jgi:electron transfer flavoprotein alpha subunit
MSVLVVMEQEGGAWHKMSWEALAAGLELGRTLSQPVAAVLLGDSLHVLERELAGHAVERVYSLRHPLLGSYTPDGFTMVLGELIRRVNASWVVMPHTYQVRDFAPKLAAALDCGFISDVTGFRLEGETPVLVRQLFQGRLHADLSFEGPPPHLFSVQAGAFRADRLSPGGTPAAVDHLPVALEAAQIRTRPLERFQEAKRTVDLSSAPIIVAVGRGIKGPEHLPLIEELARALGAEIGASRPVCDSGWLPLERQVGSSGQTVAPKLYLAVGISGAIQHLVGMKGSRVVVAINKDATAPIFEVADYGVAGDLFEIVPALTAALK